MSKFELLEDYCQTCGATLGSPECCKVKAKANICEVCGHTMLNTECSYCIAKEDYDSHPYWEDIV